jgi:RNA 2',3'-cyclic 3'-phosphodiesterase
MRCFVAIDIGQDVKAGLKSLQGQIRCRSDLTEPAVKWVCTEQIHLTLKFLGEIKDKDVVEACQIVEEVASAGEGFSFTVKGLGTFGSPARVLWAGIEKNEYLLRLQKELNNRLSEVGFSADRKQFSAHLTLCRIKNATAARKLAQIAAEYGDLEIGSTVVDSICVYKSELTKQGPDYTLLSRGWLQHTL